MNALLPLLILFAANPAFALKQKRYPFATATCKLGDKMFSAKLESIYKPNGPESSDVGGAQFLLIDGKEAEKCGGKNFSDGAFTFVDANDDSLCDNTQAYSMGNKIVAVLYQGDNRPFQSILHVAFFDLSDEKTVKVEKKLGPLKDYVAASPGFGFSNLVPRSDVDIIHKQSPWGKDLAGSDEDLGAFRHVTFDNGAANIAFDPDLSYEKGPWKAFYQNKEDYLKDAGWDPQKKKFTNEVVYAPSYLNRKESDEEQKCIGMTTRRGAGVPSDKWRCLKIKHD